LAFVGGIAFGSIGLFFTASVPAIEMFNLPIFLFITPMFLFSGTFFPVENLPLWAQSIASVFPLTHLVKLTRAFCFNAMDESLLWSVLYLSAFCLLLFPLAIYKMRLRLIK
jgi:lipooligosaccharide transport system permease protein